MAAIGTSPQRWDIFCRVVDNFGDAGVCWRLANILSADHGIRVRLWIDDLAPLQALEPAVADAEAQCIAGIAVRRWGAAAPAIDDAAVVIEAFGCGLPEDTINAMAARPTPPLWLVLEYLSAETWVDDRHALASPHPRLGLPRYFFFPGFTARTGGLLCEAGLAARRQAFGAVAQEAFWRRQGYAASTAALTVSLFAYPDAPVAAWLQALVSGAQPVVVAVPGTAWWPLLQAQFGGAAPVPGQVLRRGALELRPLPFLTQAGYDELLWSCDLNLVRGEDSFVRAQWAARPLVWQPYVQDDGAHHAKREAFLARYAAGLAPAAAAAQAAFWRAWGGAGGDIAAGWDAWRGAAPDLALQARDWAEKLPQAGELAAKLVEFARGRVE